MTIISFLTHDCAQELFLRSNRAQQNRRLPEDRLVSYWSKEGWTIKAREVPRRWTDYAIAGEDAKNDPYGCFFCFTLCQSPPHISDVRDHPSTSGSEPTSLFPTSSVLLRVCHNLRQRHDLRWLRRGTCVRNSLAASAAPFVDTPPMYLMICREYDLISRSLPPLGLYGYLGYYPCRLRDAFGEWSFFLSNLFSRSTITRFAEERCYIW